MDEKPQRQLRGIVVRYGLAICDEPRRVEALLRDLCGEHKREISVLMTALRANIPRELLISQNDQPGELLVARLSKRLYDELGLAEAFARWAVESWALALGILSHPTVSVKEDPLTPPIPTTDNQLKTSNPDAFSELWVTATGMVPGLSRTEVDLWLSRLGAKIQDNINRRTDALIVGERPGQTKLLAARKHGVAEIPASELIAIIEAFMRREIGENTTLPRPANEISRWVSEQAKIRRAKQQAGELCSRCGINPPQAGSRGLCEHCARMAVLMEEYKRRHAGQ